MVCAATMGIGSQNRGALCFLAGFLLAGAVLLAQSASGQSDQTIGAAGNPQTKRLSKGKLGYSARGSNPKLWPRLKSQHRELYAHMNDKSQHQGPCAYTRDRVSTENPYPERLLLRRPG